MLPRERRASAVPQVGLRAGGRVVRGEGNREVEPQCRWAKSRMRRCSPAQFTWKGWRPRARGSPAATITGELLEHQGEHAALRLAGLRDRGELSPHPPSPAGPAFGSSAVVPPQVAMDLEGSQNGRAGKNFLKMGKKR